MIICLFATNLTMVLFGGDQCTLNFFSDAMFVFCLRSWLIIFATAIVPLFRINQIHFPLAQTLVVDLFQMFIDDETCIEAFHHYITNYRIKGAEFGSASTYAHGNNNEERGIFNRYRIYT